MNLKVEEILKSATAKARLSIEVTKRCNSSCVYCFAGAGETNSAEIPLELFKEIILQGYNAAYRHLHITGGEPLLYRDIFEGLDYAIDLGYESILLNTNGILLNKQLCQRLASYPGLTMTISLEGTEALHDRYRGNGSYQKTIRGLENGLEAGIDIIIFTIACKSLLPDLASFADDLFSRFPGINYLTLIRLVSTAGDSSPLHKEFLAPGDFIELVHIVSLINLYGLRTVLMNEPLINVACKMLGMSWVPKSKGLCHKGNLIVMADLSIYLFHTGRECCGNYESDSINRILASSRYKQATAPDKRVCPACKYAVLCSDGGLSRPTEWHMDKLMDSHYCKTVLDLIST
ncbi:MAG: radical SAM protein [Desulfosarcina sp.]|nr:radical SAM protein [Desulfobacterales bacterium]